MKLSLFYELTTQDPDVPGAVKQRFDEALEQIRCADELGFDTVWAVEHHFLPCASSNLNRPGFIGDMNRAGVACADGDAAPSSLRGRPQRTPNVDRASVGNGCAASPNRGAQAQRYASSVFPFSRSAVLAFAGAVVAGLA